mgnify:CR=1 FL=1
MSANDIRKLLETIEQMEQAPAAPAPQAESAPAPAAGGNKPSVDELLNMIRNRKQ